MADDHGHESPIHALRLQPPWPGGAFDIFCPDSWSRCRLLNDSRAAVLHDCFEPEVETFEVLVSFLHGCSDACLYIDVGCNMGVFASYAASMGARVRCFEPSATFRSSLARTAAHYGGPPRFDFRPMAVVVEETGGNFLDDGKGYRPCGIGHTRASVRVSTFALRRALLDQGRVTFLKIDIDSIDGALLHVATDLIAQAKASIDTMLVELGCMHPRLQRGDCKWANQLGVADQRHPRSGDVHDIWRLQQLGYDVYRVNTHTNHEMYDWRGRDVNLHPTPRDASWEPRYFVRGMRQLELLRRHNSSERYGELIRRSQSVLITRVLLAQVRVAQPFDTEVAFGLRYQQKGALLRLNVDNPAMDKPAGLVEDAAVAEHGVGSLARR